MLPLRVFFAMVGVGFSARAARSAAGGPFLANDFVRDDFAPDFARVSFFFEEFGCGNGGLLAVVGGFVPFCPLSKATALGKAARLAAKRPAVEAGRGGRF